MADLTILERLPGELRNRIYRYVLLRNGPFTVTATGIQEPPLLSVCKQIRQEGILIFYGENEIHVPFMDYDSSLFVKWTEKSRALAEKYNVPRRFARVRGVGNKSPHWENLSTWLKRYHEDVVGRGILPPSKATPDSSLDQLVIGGMFSLVVLMEGKPWEKVKDALEEQRLILIKIDKRWA